MSAATICLHRFRRQVVLPIPGSPAIRRWGFPFVVNGHRTSTFVRVSVPRQTDGGVSAVSSVSLPEASRRYDRGLDGHVFSPVWKSRAAFEPFIDVLSDR